MVTIMDDQRDRTHGLAICAKHGFQYDDYGNKEHAGCPVCAVEEDGRCTVEQMRTEFENGAKSPLFGWVEKLCRAVFREEAATLGTHVKEAIKLGAAGYREDVRRLSAEIQGIKQRQSIYDQQLESLKEIDRQLDERIKFQRLTWTIEQQPSDPQADQYDTTGTGGFPLSNSQVVDEPQARWCCDKLKEAVGNISVSPTAVTWIVIGGETSYAMHFCPFCGKARP